MTNEQRHNYQSFPLCDTHVHLVYQESLEKTIQIYRDIMEYFGYERIVLLAMHNSMKGSDPANNAKVLYCKSVLNAEGTERKVYGFGSLFHYFDGRDTAEGYLRQIQIMDQLGFDGVKLLEGKPQLRKKLGRRLDDPIFDEMYAYAESHGLPIKLHLGDPASFWKTDDESRNGKPNENGYDNSFPTLEQLRSEVTGILQKFPRLHLHLAHFYFMGHELERAAKFFDTWENVAFDLTPGGEMFVGFTHRNEEWRAFFKTYANRIYYGTDTYNMFYSECLEDYENGYGVGYRNNQCRMMLEKKDAFDDQYLGRLVPLDLDADTLSRIYHDNCVELLGEPRPVANELAAAYTAFVLEKLEHKLVCTETEARDGEEMEHLRKIYAYYTAKNEEGER